ncbi:hypothetical protein [Mesorhizobium kowhaii]|jgi:hypothetical protein|uniref:Uncharacterized protein n=1 Tax=Mesorhizobium kowhaii TaxID=1300272 RepID=A0A2W7CAW8_9HYPH|nr:hypothetical protein [Mesorhizobium kowhaii]PZV40372.1 hypothetical protein B5V02_00920 [Mesorhizobium kowhaii]
MTLTRSVTHEHDGELQVAPSGKAELRGFIKRTVDSYNHPAGTCAVMRDITTGHTLAPTLVIAERAASMISASS